MYGGASFVLIYLVFLALLGLPIMVAEFAVGRGSLHSPAYSFDVLEPKGTKWHLYKYVAIAGNMVLLMFYTTVAGWMFCYVYKMASGSLSGLDADALGGAFGALLADPLAMTSWMALVVLLGGGVCYLGVKAGVERITKIMMLFLLALMVVLAINSLLLPGGGEGIRYYLYPDFDRRILPGLRSTLHRDSELPSRQGQKPNGNSRHHNKRCQQSQCHGLVVEKIQYKS
jgi:NSS family neurotransmitter:Na+ symporter